MTQREQSRKARERALEVASLRRGGMALREIGDRYGFKRARACQLVKKGERIAAERAGKGLL